MGIQVVIEYRERKSGKLVIVISDQLLQFFIFWFCFWGIWFMYSFTESHDVVYGYRYC